MRVRSSSPWPSASRCCCGGTCSSRRRRRSALAVALVALPVVAGLALALLARRHGIGPGADRRRHGGGAGAGVQRRLARLGLIALAAGDRPGAAGGRRAGEGGGVDRAAGPHRLGSRAGDRGGGLRAGALAAPDRAGARRAGRGRPRRLSSMSRPAGSRCRRSGSSCWCRRRSFPDRERLAGGDRGGADGGDGAAVPGRRRPRGADGPGGALAPARRGPASCRRRSGRARRSAGTALLAGYPWLREEPLPAYLALLGLRPGPALAAVAVGLLLALAGFGVWMGRGWGEPLRSARLAGLAAACVALALLAGLPDSGTALLAPEVPVVLDAGHPAWEAQVPGRGGSAASSSSPASRNGAGLAPGTPVAIVRLRDAAGAGARLGPARRRGDGRVGGPAAGRGPRRRQGAAAPGSPGWRGTSWPSATARGGPWSGRSAPRSLRIERAPGVPPDLAVAVYQLEIRR